MKYGEHILNDLGCAFENISPFGFNADGCGSGGAGQVCSQSLSSDSLILLLRMSHIHLFPFSSGGTKRHRRRSYRSLSS